MYSKQKHWAYVRSRAFTHAVCHTATLPVATNFIWYMPISVISGKLPTSSSTALESFLGEYRKWSTSENDQHG